MGVGSVGTGTPAQQKEIVMSDPETADSDPETPAVDDTRPSDPLPPNQPDAMSGGAGSNWTNPTLDLDPVEPHTHPPGDPNRILPSTDAADVQSAAQTRDAVHHREGTH